MINIEEYKDITHLTTFGIPVKARYYAEYSNENELLAISRKEEFVNDQVLCIGGGSNLVFLSDFNGLVLHSAIKGIKEYRKDSDTLFVIAGSGEKWSDFVNWCLDHNYAGVENLAHIPGEVGASAIQNVGAYGVEAGDLIHSVECFDVETRKTVRFTREQCRFGYRDSMFKNEGKGRYIVLRVSFRLKEDGKAENLEYGPLKGLESKLGHYPSIKEVAEAVTEIRDSKLPDPAILGSAGSFFKNPVISSHLYKKMQELFPGIPGYQVSEGMTKLSAAWLIDQAGMKGYRIGGAAVYDKQPLVLVNTGNATGKDVRDLADEVIRKVRSKFFVTLKPEANFIDTAIMITILGSGTSKGVPEVGCECRVCTSDDVRDKRLRASVLVETAGMRILIDPSPDFREQALRLRLADIDAVLVTHSHYDHVGGFDDLRPFCANGDLPVYLRKDVNSDLHSRLDYCFKEHPYPGVPTFKMNEISNKPFLINGLKITPIEVYHGKLPIYGYRIGDFAYITDAKNIPEEEKVKLENLQVLILNSLRDMPHFAHLTISEAVDVIRELKPAEAFLTHFGHEAGLYDEIDERTPGNVHPAYDGLVIKINMFK